MNTDCRFIDWLADCGQHHIGPVARHAELRIAIQVGKIWNFPGCEDLGETHLPSDLEKEEPVVDTDQASGEESESHSSFTSDATEDECEALKAKLKGHGSATGGHGSATGGHGSATCGHGSATGGHASATYGASGPCVFDNGYFFQEQ